MPTTDPQKRPLHTLDAMRGVAALAVVLLHYNTFFAPFVNSNGGLAVDLFFAMSGVVLSRNYEGRFKAGMTASQFMTVRLIRLYPLYLLSVVIAALVAIASLFGHGAIGWTPRVLAQDLALALFMLPAPSPSGGVELFPLNPPTWSLFFELLINFAFVALWPWLTTRRLIAVCLLCVPAIVAIAFTHGDLDAGWEFATAWIGAIRTVFSFSLGVIIARLPSPHGPSSSGLSFLALVASIGLALFVPPEIIGWPVWSLAWVVVLFPAIVYAATRIDPPKFLVPAATFAGIASYAVYIVHFPLLQFTASLIGRLSGGLSRSVGPVGGPALIAAFVVGAWALHNYYDTPMRRMLRARNARVAAPES